MNYWTQSEKNIFVAAHMGWCAKYPENTMPAFRAAMTLDIDQIETDIRITKDKELVLIHDATVDRTTNGSGKVCDMTLEELRKLDAGIKKSEEFRGTPIPTLRELLELVKDHPTITMDFELKEYPEAGWEDVAYETCDLALRLIDEYGFTDRCVINIGSAKLHEYVQVKYGSRYKHHVYYPVQYMGEYKVSPYAYGYCACMGGPECGMATREDFEAMRRAGVRTWAGTSVRDEETVTMAVERGAELITCNNPDEILEILKKLKLHK